MRCKWLRNCPCCGAQLEKEDPQDKFRCKSCRWEEKQSIWPKR